QELEEGEELPERKITSFDLLEYFPFTGGTQELNEFLYVDSALEVFGHAGESKLNAVQHLNQLHNWIEDEGHEPIIISKELNNSKPSTLFFLSKLSGKFNTIKFVREYENKWDHVDVLITANPYTLESKPQGKVSIKVINDYNKNCESDYTIIDLKEILDDKTTLNKVLNTQTVTFTEIED
ncbi:hypothetical protein EB151_10690, partial [archaeon]|nr:hypothetical protein [archaeon]